MSVNPAHTVIVLVDDDVALLELLAGLIRGPGRLVDTLSGGEGLTPELIALSQPRLVLINPRTGGLGPQQMFELIRSVRSITAARFLLMLDDRDTNTDLGTMTQRFGADEAMPIRVLLRNPLQEMVETGDSVMMQMPMEPAAGGPSAFSTMAAEDILNMDFTDQLAPAAPAKPAAPAAPALKPHTQKAALDLTQLIDEELAKAAEDAPKRTYQFDIQLNTMSEHNLFTSKGKVAGIFAGTVFPPDLGCEAQVKLTFPWGESFEVGGTTAWTRNDVPFGKRKRGGIGIELRIDAKLKAAMDRFVGLRAPLTAP